MAKTKTKPKATPPRKAPTVTELRSQAKALGIKGYSKMARDELATMIAAAASSENGVQAPKPYEPKVEVLAGPLTVTGSVEVRVDGQLEIAALEMTPVTPPNMHALLRWLTTDAPDGYQQMLAAFQAQKAAAVREHLLAQYVHLNGDEAA